MNKYTIYCTESQIRKALELGAPIEVDFQFNFKTAIINNKAYIVPTAEQMLSWLEEQRKFRYIGIDYYLSCNWCYSIYPWTSNSICQNNYSSRKEATLAAINAALEYLNNNNKNDK